MPSDTEPLEPRPERLKLFAEAVLDILSEGEEWNSETTSRISSVAHDLQLARDDDELMFQKIPPNEGV